MMFVLIQNFEQLIGRPSASVSTGSDLPEHTPLFERVQGETDGFVRAANGLSRGCDA
jgi:hypothetical protein